MKILMTGATGYLGSHLLKSFFLSGHQIVILKRSSSDCSRINDLIPKVISYNIDQCSLEDSFVEHNDIECVVHVATCYGRNQESAGTIYEANTLLPIKLIELAASYGVGIFLNTDTCLDKSLNVYALSKKHFTEFASNFTKDHKIKFVNILLEHFYGPDDDESKFTSYVINSCLKNVEELKLTPGEQKRDFIFIEDVIRAYELLLDEVKHIPDLFQEYELGSGKAISIRDFVNLVHDLTSSRTRLNFGALPYRDQETMLSCSDITKLKKIGWSPKESIVSGLEKTIQEARER